MKTKHSEFYKNTLQIMGEYGKANPELMGAFAKMHKEAVKEGALSLKDKSLISLGISIGVRCEACIAVHVTGSLANGATSEEIIDVIGVAIYMGGGPSVVFGSMAYDMMKEFQQAK